MSISSKAGDIQGLGRRNNTAYDWIELQRKAGAEKETSSITSAGTLVDGTPLTPQQLGKGICNQVVS